MKPFIFGMQSAALAPRASIEVSMVSDKVVHLQKLSVSKDVGESFNLVRAKIGHLDILVSPVPMSMFYVEPKSKLELIAEELEELLDEVKADLPWPVDFRLSGNYKLARAAVNALPQLLALVPRQIEPPSFSYVVEAGAEIVLTVENVSDKPAAFRCVFWAHEMPGRQI